MRGGPILLIWPDGIFYGALTPERVERIVREHIVGGTPIEPWILGRRELRQPRQGADPEAPASLTPDVSKLDKVDPPRAASLGQA